MGIDMDDTAATALGSGAESDAQAMLRTGQGLNEDQLGKVLQLTSDGMIISDGAERILHANPVALALFDVDLNDIVNTPLEDLLGCMKAVDDASLLAHLADASSQEPDRVFQVFRRLIQIEQAPIPITSDSQGSLTVLRDVTSLVRGEEKLAELRERAQQLMNRTEHLSKLDYLKSRFIADMSHDLRNPLNSIIGFSSVILKGIDGPITDLQREDLEKINSSGKILLEMVSDMLDVSQLWAGKTQLRYSPIDLNSLIQEALSN